MANYDAAQLAEEATRYADDDIAAGLAAALQQDEPGRARASELSPGGAEALNVDQVLGATGRTLHLEQVLIAAEEAAVACELSRHRFGPERVPACAGTAEPLDVLADVEAAVGRGERPVADPDQTFEADPAGELGWELLEPDRPSPQLRQCDSQSPQIGLLRVGTDIDVLGRADVAVSGDGKPAYDDELDSILDQGAEQSVEPQRLHASGSGRLRVAHPGPWAASSVATRLSSAARAIRCSEVKPR